jgi:alanine dehydrogenase
LERARLWSGQTLFTYLHLAADPEQARALIDSGATSIAYETVMAPDGTLPLRTPMSEVAGRMSVQVGAHFLEKYAGGRGILLGGVPGVAPANVVILGGGVAGSQAAEMAIGLGADVTLVDRSLAQLRELASRVDGRAKTAYSNAASVAALVQDADLVIGTVLIPGAAASKLVAREMVRSMKPGSVVVDVAIDQGGCFETSRPTSHDEPTFVESGVIHYCVTNMPGAVPRTSTFALCNATLPYIRRLADLGTNDALKGKGLATGLNVHDGKIVHPVVANALGDLHV